MAGPSGVSAPGTPLSFPTDDISTLKLWAKRVEREVLPKTIFQRFMSSGVAMFKDEMTKSAGDRVKFNFENLVEDDGAIQDEILSLPDPTKGKEFSGTWSQDNIDINQLRFAYRWKGRINTQRVVMNIRRSARNQLSDNWARVKDNAFLYHIVGDTWIEDLHATLLTPPADDLPYSLKLTGLNAIRPATANNLIDADTQKMDLDIVEDMVLRAKTMKDEYGQPVIMPVMVEGEEMFPIIMHNVQWRDLRRNTAEGQWLDIQKATLAGGLIERNPIFTGSGGVYGNAVFFESSRIGKISTFEKNGNTEPNHRAAVLLGKGAVCYAHGREGGRDESYIWDEESYDLKNQHVVGAAQIWGIAKTQFGDDGVPFDYGVIRVDTWAAVNKDTPPTTRPVALAVFSAAKLRKDAAALIAQAKTMTDAADEKSDDKPAAKPAPKK